MLSFKLKKYFIASAMALVLLVNPVLAGPTTEAQSKLESGFGKVFDEQGTGGPKPIGEIVAQIIEYVLSFLGIVFVILVIYSGFNWMTATGDSDKVATAKETLINATIGLVIVLASYTITYFILSNLLRATTDAVIG